MPGIRNGLFLWVILSLAGLLLGGCRMPTPPAPQSPSVVAIVDPLNGQQFRAGDMVVVRSKFDLHTTAHQVLLGVNGNAVRLDTFKSRLESGEFQQGWFFSEPGVYTLIVQVMFEDGGGIASEAVQIVVGEAPTPTITLTLEPTPSATATPTLTPSTTLTQTPSPTGTYTPVPTTLVPTTLAPTTEEPPTPTWTEVPRQNPPPAPQAISPSGVIKCVSTVNLTWEAVKHTQKISHYEYELVGPTGAQSGVSRTTRVETPVICNGSSYTWRVRAVDALGLTGDYSETLKFNVR